MPDTLYKRNDSKKRYIYCSDLSAVESNGHYVHRVHVPGIDDPNYKNNNFANFISENKKIIIYFNQSYYHFIVDMIGTFFEKLKEENVEIIFYSEYEMLEYPAYVKEFFNTLDILKIKYTIVFKNNFSYILLNNFYYYDHSFYMLNDKTIKSIESFFNCTDINPGSKKVYVSRKNLPNRKRINDEIILEKYLIECGFDIVVPNNFLSFKDQVNYFKDVGLIVSCTSAGLTNQIFMPRGSVVIELVSLMSDIQDGEETSAFHHFYSVIASLKKHTYIGISNCDGNANDIISQIENNNVLKKVIKNE